MALNVGQTRKVGRSPGRFPFLLPFIAVMLLTSCLLDPDRGSPGRVWDGSPGFVELSVGLERNERHAMAKRSAADTTFGLDSLIIVLTATGADTLRYSYPISGRPDTGVIAISPKVYTLNPLLNWKARIYSIDTTANPVRRDTVHLDSVIFAVRPADTAFVSKTVSAAFSIIRARFLSSNQDSLGTSIRFIRLKVGGVTRDSLDLYGETFNAVWFATVGTGWLVQDSGRVQKTTDSGRSWYPQNAGTSLNLRAVSFANTSLGWIAGDSGLIKRTINGGASWTAMNSRTDLRLNRIHFVSPTTGYVVGDSGFAMKSIDSGKSWKPVSGGWFKSPNVSPTITDIGFPTASKGIAVTNTGAARITTDFGGTWTPTAGTTKPYNAVHFSTATGRGYAVADSGYILRYDGTNWAGQSVVQGSKLHGVFVRGNDSGWAVGDSERVVRNTTNGGGAWAVVPSGWQPQTSTPARSWYGIAFGTSTTGWIVGADSSIRVTTNRGSSWAQVPFNSPKGNRHLRAVAAFNANIAIAVGDSGYAARIRTGTNWNWYATGAGTSVHYRGVAFHPTLGRRAWAVSPISNTIRSTDDTGRTWASRNPTTSGVWNAVSASSSYIYVVGNGGVVRRSSNLNATANFNTVVSNAPLSTDAPNLYAASFRTTNADTGWVVGGGGRVYRTHDADNGTAASVPWTRMATPDSSTDLIGVRFINGSTGWVTGVNGKIWRTTDRGTTWQVQYHGATDSLRSVWSNHTDTAYLVGSNGVIRATTTAGNFVSAKSTPQKLNGVHFPSNTVGYIVGSNGTISKTTNAGLRWTAQTNSDPDTLNGVHFVHIDTGWAVGNNGTLLKTVNGGTSWSPQTHPAGSVHFRKVRFSNGQRGWVVGDNGTILRTTNSGANWVAQESGTNKTLRALHAVDGDTAYVAGDDGIIRKTVNGGVLIIFYHNLNGFYARNDSLYVVGDQGLIYRSRNGGGGWTRLTHASLGTTKMNATYSGGSNTHFVGNGGKWFTITHTLADSVVTQRTSQMTVNINGVWGSPTGAQTSTILVGDSGIYGRVNFISSPAAVDTITLKESLRGIHCATGDSTCWVVGTRELVLRNTAPNFEQWNLMSVGAKRFDFTLSSKYLRPGIMDSVIIQAIDRASPLRGYEKRLGILVGAGQDSTINTGMTRCGYGGATPPCRP